MLRLLLGSSLLLQTALVQAIVLARGPACTTDTCGDAFTRALGMPRQQSASAFCSSYMTAAPASTTTSTTTTTISNVITETGSSTYTTTITQYPCPVPNKKRGEATQTVPSWAERACPATGTVRSEERLSSACSCFSITGKPTEVVTAYETLTTTAPSFTTTIVPTVTETEVDPWHPVPTNFISNPGFEDGLAGWTTYTSDNLEIFGIVSPGKNSTKLLQVNYTSPGVPEGEYGSNYFATFGIKHNIPAIRANYQYVLNFDYRYIVPSRSIWSVKFNAYVGNKQIAWDYDLDGWWDLDRPWNSRQVYFWANEPLSGPLELYFRAFWDVNERANEVKTAIEIDNVSWVAEVGCTPQ